MDAQEWPVNILDGYHIWGSSNISDATGGICAKTEVDSRSYRNMLR